MARGLAELLRRVERLEQRVRRGPDLSKLSERQRWRYDEWRADLAELSFAEHLDCIDDPRYSLDSDIWDVLYPKTRILPDDTQADARDKYERMIDQCR